MAPGPYEQGSTLKLPPYQGLPLSVDGTGKFPPRVVARRDDLPAFTSRNLRLSALAIFPLTFWDIYFIIN